MTRRRIIAGVILVAAVVVGVPVAPEMWERIAYRDAVLTDDGFMVRRKQWEWLPGRTVYVPDQVCRYCLRGEHGHGYCWRDGTADEVWFGALGPVHGPLTASDLKRAVLLYRPGFRFRCTCTDPSHDGDSE